MVGPSNEFVNRVLEGGRAREEALLDLYQNETLRQSIKSLILKGGGSVQDVEDIFQDAIVLLDANIRKHKFRGDGTVDGYLYGIARLLWKKRQNNQWKPLQLEHLNLPEIPDWVAPNQDDRIEKLQWALKKLNQKCHSIITLVLHAFSMEEIAVKIGYKNSDVAKKEASLCRKKLKQLIQKISEG
jgi:RNA polymerase sigma factor (sigma-70 family)